MKKRNSSVFTSITSEEQAYWLGFLTADGSVKGGGQAVTVHIAGKDKEHLYRFRRFLNAEHIVSEHKDGSVSFTVYDGQIARDLEHFGVRVGERFVPPLPNELVRHYYRGLFDGDGYIAATKTGRNLVDSWQLVFVGSHSICESFAEQVRMTGIKARVFFNSRIWRCRICGQESAKRVAAWLYQNATVYLPRKQRVFLAMTEGTGQYVDRTDDCIRPKDLASLLGISSRAILKHISSGKLQAHKVGQHWWIEKFNAENWYRKFYGNHTFVETPVESDVRPIAVSLAASLKQEPSTESYGRFW